MNITHEITSVIHNIVFHEVLTRLHFEKPLEINEKKKLYGNTAQITQEDKQENQENYEVVQIPGQ